jgi:tripartite-type tricarboxylate transporter receptor subunit TctC
MAAWTQPMRLIVPNAPGGPTDTTARLTGQKLAERLGVPVVIDNRPGATGTMGGEIVAKSAPDGRTLLLTSSSAFVSTPILMPNAPYDGRRDFAQVTAILSVPYLLFVNPASGPKTVNELISLARARPGTLNFGSSGAGSTSHLTAVLFNTMAGINVLHVPYKGSAPAAIDLIGGQLNFIFEAVAGGMPLVKSGRLRALGISSTKRLPLLHELNTIAEAGLPGYEASVIHGICVTAKTPPALVARLHRELVAAITVPEVRERLAAIGAEVLASTPEEYQAATRAEIRRWEKLVRDFVARSG